MRTDGAPDGACGELHPSGGMCCSLPLGHDGLLHSAHPHHDLTREGVEWRTEPPLDLSNPDAVERWLSDA